MENGGVLRGGEFPEEDDQTFGGGEAEQGTQGAPQERAAQAPGAALPDNKTYGVFWAPYKELATAFQMYGAFNSVALTLAPGASASETELNAP